VTEKNRLPTHHLSIELRKLGHVITAVALFAAGVVFTQPVRADDNTPGKQPKDSGLYVKVLMTTPVKMSKLKPGDSVEGTLARDVYGTERKLFSAGSPVRLTVDHLERRRRTPNDHWPWLINVFTPRHENFPVFQQASVHGPAGDSPLQVSLISISKMHQVFAQGKKSKSPQAQPEEPGAVETTKSVQKNPAVPTMILEAFGLEGYDSSAVANRGDGVTDNRILSIPAGTHARILLLGDVSASRSRPGDSVTARILEPIVLNEKVAIPAGSLVHGKVVKRTPPRMLSRAGSLYLSFNEITLPEGNRVPIAAYPAGAELNQRSHTRMDREGGLHGERPGKAWMAINLGMTAGVAKVADDSIQLIIEAVVSTATDVSTAGTGRIVAACASGIFLATRHGRDVMLPRFSEMEITMERDISLEPMPVAAANVVAGTR